MKKLLRRITLLLTLSLVLPVTAAELEGVKMPDSLKLHNGKTVGTQIAGEDFYRALLRIWLGEKPAQESLKYGWLGKN